MNYKLVKGKRSAIGSYDKYVAKVVHQNTVRYEDFFKEVEIEGGSATLADVHGVMDKLMKILIRHLKRGDTVEFPYLGRMKLEVISAAVDNKEDFNIRDHIKGVRVKLTPYIRNGSKELYNDVPLKRVDSSL